MAEALSVHGLILQALAKKLGDISVKDRTLIASVRKYPRTVKEDQYPLAMVCYGMDSLIDLTFEKDVKKTFEALIVILNNYNADKIVVDADVVPYAREQAIFTTYDVELDIDPHKVLDVFIDPNPVFDASQLDNNLDWSAFLLRFEVITKRVV